jgi:hypothetical protein
MEIQLSVEGTLHKLKNRKEEHEEGERIFTSRNP